MQQVVDTKRVQRIKSTKDSIFRSSLFVILSLIVTLLFSLILMIVVKGTQGLNSDSVMIKDFLFGNYYNPTGGFFVGGVLIFNSIWTAALAALIAVPISVLTALFITRVAPKSLRTPLFVIVALLAAVPSVIYGAFGGQWINSLVYSITGVANGPLLSLIFTLALMIMPTITLLTVAAINNVDKKMENSSLALGATRAQTNFKVTLVAAIPGILVGTLLGIGRALGEATAVSMVASQASYGPTFLPTEYTRLITSTMLKGFKELEIGSDEYLYRFALGLLLVTTTFAIFALLKYVQRKQDPENKSMQLTASAVKTRTIAMKYEQRGLEGLSINEQHEWYRIHLEREAQFDLAVENEFNTTSHSILTKSIIKKNNESAKKVKSSALNAMTVIFSLVGILSFVAIMSYLLGGGTSVLTWEFLASSGEVTRIENGARIYGMATPIMGTMVMIFATLIIAVPMGVMTGIYFAEFSKKGKISNLFSTSIELLAGIPSLIFGLFGAAVFLPLAAAIGYEVIAGILIMVMIVLPTIIKTSEEAIKAVPDSIKHASLALGSTKSTSAIKVGIPNAIPGILSGVILSTGRIIAESAAIVMIFGAIVRPEMGDWLTSGGTTLATEIFRLTGDYQVISWDYIKAIGIIIMAILTMLVIISKFIERKNWILSAAALLLFLTMLLGIGIYSQVLFMVALWMFIALIIFQVMMSIVKWLTVTNKIKLPTEVKNFAMRWK